MTKKLTLLTIAILSLGVAGCKTKPNIGPMTHAAFTAAVTLGEQYALEKHPESVPYVRAGSLVVCSVANGTNVSAQAIVDALKAAGVTNATAKLIINGALAIFNVVTANLSTNQTELRAYAQDLCNGMVAGLPPERGPARNRRVKALHPHL